MAGLRKKTYGTVKQDLGGSFFRIGGSIYHLHMFDGSMCGYFCTRLIRQVNEVFTYQCNRCGKQLNTNN